jgi:LemA protein
MDRNMTRRIQKTIFLLLFALTTASCGYNTIQSQEEAVSSAWSEVLSQYQRRADLVPNLVNTVKAYAAHESEVLTSVTEARSKVGAIQVNAQAVADPAKLQEFQAAQSQLSGALGRLIAVAENYPQLKADASFRDLMTALEGTENRITVARKRYIDSVRDFNVTIRSFPTNLTAKLFGYDVKPNFTVENEQAITTAPKVDFSK